jgi:hypothetical protein
MWQWLKNRLYCFTHGHTDVLCSFGPGVHFYICDVCKRRKKHRNLLDMI